MKRKGYLTINRLQGLCKRMKDPRRHYGNLRHDMVDMLIMMLLAVICGCETWEEIHDYAMDKRAWLKTFLTLPGGIPSASTFRRMLCAIKPEALESVYRQWVTPYVGSCIRKQVNFDGKTVCGVKRGGDAGLHIVSAWVREDGISLGQVRVGDKSNEITAIPKLIEELDIMGGVVTIDAMGCQRTIAESIIANDANYVLAVKRNQPILYEEIMEYFQWAKADQVEKRFLRTYEKHEHDHGREASWRVTVTTDVLWFESKKNWKALRSFIMVERTRTVKNITSCETAYYISSLEQSAQEAFSYVRGHWSIENQLHWMLDVAFREDHCKIHAGNAPQNLSLLRKLALACLRNDHTTKASIPRKQKRAARNNHFAFSLISG